MCFQWNACNDIIYTCILQQQRVAGKDVSGNYLHQNGPLKTHNRSYFSVTKADLLSSEHGWAIVSLSEYKVTPFEYSFILPLLHWD